MKNKISTTDINSVLSSGGKKSRKKLFLIIAAAAVVLAVAYLFVRPSGTGSSTPQFTTADVSQGDIIVTVSATGSLEPTNQVEVGSELSGTIRDVYADYNTAVKKDQLLAKIDTTKLQAQVTQSQASLEAAKANVLLMQATEKETLLKLNQLKKLWELTDKKSPSQTEIDAAEAAYERAVANTASAKASVTQAKATLDSHLTDLSKAEIRSPVDGIVLNRSIEPGQTVAASYQAPVLFTLAEDLKKMELMVYVDEADIGQIKEGQKAAFTVDAYPEKVFSGVITQARYGSQTVDNVVTYETVIQVDNSDMLLRPGMTATADITVKEINNVILVPNAALRYAPAQTGQDEKTSFISKLMPHPPRTPKQKTKTAEKGSVTVWALENGAEVPYVIKLGVSDSSHRQMLEGKLTKGMKLITGKAVNGK